jgi:hypothetical protein
MSSDDDPAGLPSAAGPVSAAGLAAALEGRAEVGRVAADIAELARSPRGRPHHPEAMARAQRYVTGRLSQAGWRVTAAPFTSRRTIGVSGAGGQTSIVRRLRLLAPRPGINLLAELPGAPATGQVLVVAHLDTVDCSPGADDNASGVAALIECARLLATLPEPPAVRLAVVDLEELGKLGSAALARDRSYVRDLRAVVCLESVGTFSSRPRTQRLGGLGLLFRDVAARVAANQHRGDFVLAVCRRSTSPAAQILVAAGAALREPLSILIARDPRADGRRGRLITGLFPLLANLDRSDHAPFWNRGVPAMMLTTTAPFRNRHYHREGDRPEEVDCPRVTALAVAVAATVAAVATEPRAAGGGCAPCSAGRGSSPANPPAPPRS